MECAGQMGNALHVISNLHGEVCSQKKTNAKLRKEQRPPYGIQRATSSTRYELTKLWHEQVLRYYLFSIFFFGLLIFETIEFLHQEKG